MAKLIILCGLPGSGKSQYALNYKAVDDAICKDFTVIHSSDAIREELFGDADSQEDNGRVFELMHNRVKEDLKAGKTVIYDATNVTRKARRGAINLATKADTVECHIIWTDPIECRRRDSLRDRKVGSEVIEKMLRRWQSPFIDEGFDSINIVLNQYDFDYVNYISSMTTNMHIPHDNPHHTLGVWEHCMQAQSNIEQKMSEMTFNKHSHDYKLLTTAAKWHDIGKPWTKGYKANKETGVVDYSHAHYYDHHCVGGYLSYGLFLKPRSLMSQPEINDICFISWLICNHMEPFFNSHYYQDMYPHFKCYIDAIHEADVNAH